MPGRQIARRAIRRSALSPASPPTRWVPGAGGWWRSIWKPVRIAGRLSPGTTPSLGRFEIGSAAAFCKLHNASARRAESRDDGATRRRSNKRPTCHRAVVASTSVWKEAADQTESRGCYQCEGKDDPSDNTADAHSRNCKVYNPSRIRSRLAITAERSEHNEGISKEQHSVQGIIVACPAVPAVRQFEFLDTKIPVVVPTTRLPQLSG